MMNVIDISLGDENYANPGEEIPESAFGAEFLGWEYFQNFEERYQEVEYHHVRWPGGIPVEDGINVDGSPDGSREHVFDLRNENLVDWDRLDEEPREGIEEMMGFAVENDISFSFVAPTSRYVEQAIEEGEQIGLDAARADIRYFVENLLAGEYGEVPADFTIELGSEYYSTDVWKKYTTDETGEPYTLDPGDLPATFGKVFAVMAEEIEAVLVDPNLNPDGIDIRIAVQLGRNGDDNAGTFGDNFDFINAFNDEGSLDAIDSLIFHKYIPTFDHIGRGTEWNSNGLNLEDAVNLWESAVGKELDLTVGYLSPAAQSPGKLEYDAPGLTNILQMNADLLSEGMDQGSIYALGHSTEGSLGWKGDVFIGGQLYGMMAESLPGMYLHSGFEDNTSNVLNLGEEYVISDEVNTYVYENEESVVVFLSAKDFEGTQLDYTIQFDGEITSGEITKLWDSGEFVTNPTTGEVVGHFGDTLEEAAMIQTDSGTSSIPVTFNHDYEVIRLILEKAPSIDEPVNEGETSDFIGTLGDDIIEGDFSDNKMNGLEGKDYVSGEAGNDTVKGGWGSDTLVGGSGDDRVSGDNGNDSLNGSGGFDTLFGGFGDDTLNGDEHADLLYGGEGDDSLVGGMGTDILYGEAGNDTLNSGSEADRLYGGAGDDLMFGGWALGTTVDGLWGDEGNDTLYGELGYDMLDGGEGNDLLDGGDQADNLYGQAGNDTLRGGQGFDRLFGGDGNDFLRGGSENDGLFGGVGNDTLNGEAGNDRFFGELGNDLLDGGTGNDTMGGGAGFDTLKGGTGNDVLLGNFNADQFVFEDGHGDDTIGDFEEFNVYEQIDLRGVSAIVNMYDMLLNHTTQAGVNVVIDTGGGNSITLNGVNLTDLDSTDFVF